MRVQIEDISAVVLLNNSGTCKVAVALNARQ